MNAGAQFCPDVVEHEAAPDVPCHASLNGVDVERISPVQVDVVTEPVAAAAAAPLDREPFRSLHSPRGPPVG